jgi:NADH:ubiquinone oxidoreductase subunit 6 (subunit J)
MEFNKIIKLVLVFALIVIIALNLGIRIIPESGEIMRTTTSDLSAIFGSFLLAFEILAILLTAAMVGAIVIAKKDKKTNLEGGDAQ